MSKSIILSLLVLMVYSHVSFGQDQYSDNKISVTSEILKHEDPTNDAFYEYYNFTLKNESNEVQKFNLIISFDQNGEAKTTESRDEDYVFELQPGEVLSGDLLERRELTLFKSFLPGNSGKKASSSEVVVESINVTYL